MAFPTVAATNKSSTDTAGTSHTVSLPTGIASGHLLLMLFGSRDAPGTVSASGWTFLSTDNRNASYLTIGYRVADGSEGSTVSVSTVNSRKTAHITYRITGSDTGTAPVKATAASGLASTAMDPPSNSPGWTEDTLWLAVVDSSSTTTHDAPTDYTNFIQSISSGGSAGTNSNLCSAERQLNAASEDPGAFVTVASTNAWVGQTVAIKPGAAAYSLTCGSGSLSLTGQAAALKTSRIFGLGVGAHSLTGVAASMNKGRSLVGGTGSYALTGAVGYSNVVVGIGAGSYSLTGNAVTLTKGSTAGLAMGVGSYSLSGQAAGLNKGKTLTAAAGSYALVGAVSFNDRFFAASVGSYSYTGVAVTLQGTTRQIAIGTGSYTFSIADDILNDYGENGALGTYSLTGVAAQLLRGKKIAIGTGAYTLTGVAAAFRITRAIAANTGAYTWVGREAALSYTPVARAINVGTGAYTLSLTDLGANVNALAGAYTLSGQAASLQRGYRLDASAGSYALSGVDVSTLAKLKLQAELGSYVLTASELGRALTTATGSHALTGQNVTFSRTRVLQAGVGAHALTGGPLIQPRLLVAGSGAYTVTGKQSFVGRQLRLSTDRVASITEESRTGAIDAHINRLAAVEVETRSVRPDAISRIAS